MTFIGGIYRKSSPHKSTELFEIDPAWMHGTSQNDGTLWNQSRMRGTLIVLDNHGVLFYFNWKSKNRRRLYLVSREKNTNGKCYKYRFLRAHLTNHGTNVSWNVLYTVHVILKSKMATIKDICLRYEIWKHILYGNYKIVH